MPVFWRPPAPAAEIEAFERRHGARLPDSYRRFLLRHDGGMPAAELRREDGRNVLLMQVVPLAFAEKLSATFFGCLARGLLPIGIDGGGDYFLLELRSSSLHYWDHHVDEYTASAEELPVVTSDLEEILARLDQG